MRLVLSLILVGIFMGQEYKIATFAGGCFWCMEQPFDEMEGVISTISGYTGGTEKNPTYEQVSRGKTTHCEAVQVTYDPKKVSYEDLLRTFWRNINPVQEDGQFYDRGPHYRTEIFVHDETQKQLAEKSKKELDESGKFNSPIVTEITMFTVFYPAEEYHQNYYQKNALHYSKYKKGSGREDYIKQTWGNE